MSICWYSYSLYSLNSIYIISEAGIEPSSFYRWHLQLLRLHLLLCLIRTQAHFGPGSYSEFGHPVYIRVYWPFGLFCLAQYIDYVFKRRKLMIEASRIVLATCDMAICRRR